MGLHNRQSTQGRRGKGWRGREGGRTGGRKKGKAVDVGIEIDMARERKRESMWEIIWRKEVERDDKSNRKDEDNKRIYRVAGGTNINGTHRERIRIGKNRSNEDITWWLRAPVWQECWPYSQYLRYPASLATTKKWKKWKNKMKIDQNGREGRKREGNEKWKNGEKEGKKRKASKIRSIT